MPIDTSNDSSRGDLLVTFSDRAGQTREINITRDKPHYLTEEEYVQAWINGGMTEVSRRYSSQPVSPPQTGYSEPMAWGCGMTLALVASALALMGVLLANI